MVNIVAQKIWEEVKENKRRLDSCEGVHDFSIDIDPEKNHNKRTQCTKCKGYVWPGNLYWYNKGVEHANR